MIKKTKEHVLSLYDEYINGSTLKELNKKYNTDSAYLFKKYKLKTRNSRETLVYRNKIGIDTILHKYTYRFENISNEKEAYIIGFWFSDGWISEKQAGLKLMINDKELLTKIKNYISLDIKLQETDVFCAFVISNIEIVENIVKLGCLRNKTYLELNIPDIDDDLIRHFIRGYFDGDGTVYRDREYLKCNICSINLSFLEKIQQILLKNNINSKINTEIRENKRLKIPNGYSTNCKNMYRLFIRKKEDFLKFYNFLYTDSTIHLDRKYVKFNNGNTVLNKENNNSLSM